METESSLHIFEESKNPKNTSRWVSIFHHHTSAAGAPGQAKLERWANAHVTDVVTLLRHDEMASWLPEACAKAGLTWHHIPLSGKRLAAANDKTSLKHLIDWAFELQETRDTKRIVVHCAAGMHRTGVALYTMMRCAGLCPEAAVKRIIHARPLTAHELTRNTRRSGRLVDVAEQLFQDLSNP